VLEEREIAFGDFGSQHDVQGLLRRKRSCGFGVRVFQERSAEGELFFELETGQRSLGGGVFSSCHAQNLRPNVAMSIKDSFFSHSEDIFQRDKAP
jgi:hypothetical protein